MLLDFPERIAGTADEAVPLVDRGLRVETGTADLYLDHPGRAGRRRHLLTLAAGEIALPLPPTDRMVRLLALPAPGARLSTFEPDVFLGRLDAPSPEAIAATEAWIGRTLHTLAEPVPGRPAILGEGAGRLDPGVPGRPERGLLWISVTAGTVHPGFPGADPCRLGDLPAAVAASAGGVASGEGARILGRSSAALAVTGELAGAVVGHQARLAAALAAAEASCEAAEAALIGGKAARDRSVLAAIVAPLVASAGAGAPGETSPGEASLLVAFRAVAEAGAATLPGEPPPDFSDDVATDEPPTVERRIADLAAWAGLHPRRIRLKPGWWSRGSQPVLGFRHDGTPVALIAGTGWRGGYRLREAGRLRGVGHREAAGLAGHGYVLQRRLPDTPIDGRGLLRFAVPLARPGVLAVLAIGLAGSLLGLALPVATNILFETVIPASSRPELVQLVAGIAALGLGGIVFELVRGFLLLRVATLLNTDLEGAVWDRLLRLPAGFFRGHAAGDMALRADAINQMRDAVGGTVIGTVLSAAFSVSSLALILSYDWRLAGVALALALVQLAVMTAVNLRLVGWKRRMLDIDGRLQAVSLQLIQGIAKLKVAGAEARGFARWAPLFVERRALEMRQSRLLAGYSAFGSAFGIAATALMIGIVGLGGLDIGIGGFIAFNAAYGQFMAATLALGAALPALLALRPLSERAGPILAAVPESLGRRGPAPMLHGGIELADVGFRYHVEGPAILDGVSIVARPGEFVGIVGPSGSGKSTLMRLLLGFERPQGGSVFFDDRDLAGLDLRAVRRQMGVVLQSSRVTGSTLLESILNGAALTEAEAWEAARLAGLDHDIQAMPMGMQTFVGEDGGLLSGGQRQRLLIARAVVRQPRILLFDEATSALDNRTQQIVSEGLERLDATRIVVAHRLSTVQKADRIYVLEAGRVVEEGRYRELLERGGLFSTLAVRQIA
ncbi:MULTISPECIES: NHLP bacteriocin export ABC transporter permease/ATPase subunit [Methylobacterium]|uniref:NHLP bacteriocin export ABC transporter permease/ATPase subunit n=1 Tax=Methylobacterium TaxID=407 RepID=UPI0013EADC6D|nr:NHLP bacteriocin export ABC transporter permease/ATPase subunit [Methylobacterium sp. DB0501]NGM37965.1 NHLP bacteriocin export ABC transporter permease/ATPase subunit [Methylobacterium sp. DB0501]